MPNILTANDSGWASNWRTSVGQGTYSKYIRYAECPEKPAAVRDCLVNSDHTWREATAEEIAERDYVAPRTQSAEEYEFQVFCQQLKFDHKPKIWECEATLEDIAETDPVSALTAGLKLVTMRSVLIEDYPWDEWIWV